TRLALAWAGIGPVEFHFRLIRLDDLYLFVVLDDDHPGKLLRADEVDAERRRRAGGKFLAHEMLHLAGLAAHVGDDVVGGAVDAAFFDRVDDRLARWLGVAG